MKLAKQSYKITTLSPVHIGSTRQWLQHVNYEPSQGAVDVFHLPSIPLEESEETFFSPDQKQFFSMAKDAGVDPILSFPDKVFAHSIEQCARNAWGNPFIPGNSLNGFFHSAILNNRFPQHWYDKSLTGNLPDFTKLKMYPSNYTVFFEDMEFSQTSASISDVKILNMTSDQSYGWKKFGKNDTSLPQPRTATSDYVETINFGETSIGNIRLRIKDHEHTDIDTYWDTFEQICNEYALAIVEKEMAFYSRCKMNEGYNFYFSLNEKLKKNSSGFYMCIGWGIGWQALFAPLHTPKAIRNIRQKHDLGKSNRQCPKCKKQLRIDRFNKDHLYCLGCKKSFPFDSVVTQLFPIFPKSRKFIIENNTPTYPLGWVRFDRNANFEKICNTESHSIEIQIMQKTSSVERTAFLTPEEYPEGKSQTKHFKKKIKIPDRGSFPTEFNIFFNKIAELEFILSITGATITDDIDTTKLLDNNSTDELLFNYSYAAKGIALTIKTGAQNTSQKNFIINRLWEVIDTIHESRKES